MVKVHDINIAQKYKIQANKIISESIDKDFPLIRFPADSFLHFRESVSGH